MKTTIADLCRSATAKRLGIKNEPDSDLHRERLEWLCARADEALTLIRRSWPGAKISSGYRNHAVNRAVGGSNTSDHPKALAIDIVAPGVVDYVPMAKYVATYLGEIGIRPQQILAESTPPHLHLGYPDESERIAGYVTVLLRETPKGWAKP